VFPIASPTGGPHTIVARGSSTNDFDTWYLGLNSGKAEFIFHDNGLVQSPFVTPLNEWTHFAITYDELNCRLYANGVQVASHEESQTLIYDPAPIPVTIGADWASNASSDPFNGRIDEISIYNRALTADEILGIYNADLLGKNFEQPYFTSPAQLLDATGGIFYSHQCSTIFGAAPVTFSLSEGMLPTGMTLTSAGLVSGISSILGIFEFTVVATDAAGNVNEQICLLRII
jgi:hypothetical protein